MMLFTLSFVRLNNPWHHHAMSNWLSLRQLGFWLVNVSSCSAAAASRGSEVGLHHCSVPALSVSMDYRNNIGCFLSLPKLSLSISLQHKEGIYSLSHDFFFLVKILLYCWLVWWKHKPHICSSRESHSYCAEVTGCFLAVDLQTNNWAGSVSPDFCPGVFSSVFMLCWLLDINLSVLTYAVELKRSPF